MATPPSTLFSLPTGSSEPISRQLADPADRRVPGRQLAPGDAMPSVREVAQALALNPMTVSKAYGILELEGVLTRKRGMGRFVADAPKGTHSVSSRIELLRPTLERAALEARQLELDHDTVLTLFTKLLKEKP